MTTPELQQSVFTRLESTSTAEAAINLGRAVITLFVDPPHDRTIWEEAEDRAGPQPLQPSVDHIYGHAKKYASEAGMDEKMSKAGMLNLANALVQFTDHSEKSQHMAKTPASSIFSLYNAITEQASELQPLSFTDQLDIAMHQTDGKLSESLWRIFLTSRLFARWRDVDAIEGLPRFSREQKINLTARWQSSLAACKPFDAAKFQDVIGDTYYCWTHVLAKYAFGSLASNERDGRWLQKTFHNGTHIMQAFANSPFNFSIGTVSDHKTAALYGNTIGEALLAMPSLDKVNDHRG